jgi:hypothetical protein
MGAFSLSAGSGANRHMVFRALQGSIGAKSYLFLSWVVRVASLDTAIDRVNVVLGDGTDYVAFQAKLGTTSGPTAAGKQNDTVFSYRIHNCTRAGNAISLVNPAVAVDGAAIEDTGRMWVDIVNAERQLETKWAFQVAIELGTAWAPTALTLPASGTFQLWYEVWASVPGMTVPYRMSPDPTVLPVPPLVQTTSFTQVVPAGLTLPHMLTMTTDQAAGDPQVRLEWGSVGARNSDGSVRADPTSILLDLGQQYPPNRAAMGSPYNVNHTPNVASAQFQNQFYANPTLPATITTTQKDSLRARFSLANWGSQTTIPTASSWRPMPGGEDRPYAGSDINFIWPLPGVGGVADAYATNLARHINQFLNDTAFGGAPSVGAQHPHQCMLVELSSTDGSVFITQNAIYQNMNVARASVFERLAEISVVGLTPIGSAPRDVYLYVQRFNMPSSVKDGSTPTPPGDHGMSSALFGKRQTVQEVEDIASRFPTFIIHAYHDTGERMELADGRRVPMLSPQSSFGYFAVHEGPLEGWETRLYGAEKIAEDFYRVRVPNNGSAYVETAIQARESASDRPLPPDGYGGHCWRLIKRLESRGFLGKLLALIVRIICRLFGGG